MAIRVACVALALAAGWGLSALPVVCLLEEAMYPFKPAICLTPVILTGPQDVPKLLLGSVNRKSRRKLGLKKTSLLFAMCSCLGEENSYSRSDWCCSSTQGQGIFMKMKHPYLRLVASKLPLQEGLHFHSNTVFCVAVLEAEEDSCFNCQCSLVADHPNSVCGVLSTSRLWNIILLV